jgi:hypothetical protein
MKTMLTFALCALLSGCGAAGAGALKGLGDAMTCIGQEMNDQQCTAQYSPSPPITVPTLPSPPAPGTPGGIYMPPPAPPMPYPHA